MLLVVDDYADSRTALVRMLQHDGYDVAAASSGAEALEYLKSHDVSLVILDYSMPDMDGLAVLSEMRREARHSKTPVIMFSASDGPLREKALREGAAAYVQKGSLDWAQLEREVVRLIGPGKPIAKAPAPPRPCKKDAG